MTEKQTESLSAFMDGQSDELSLRRLLKDTANDAELKATWGRYHQARATMDAETAPFAKLDISADVSSFIADEAPLKPASKPIFKTFAGLSVAASVAFAIVVGARFNPLMDHNAQLADKGQETDVKIVAPSIPRGPISSPSMIAQSGNLEGVDEQQLQQAQERLNSYLKRHAQDSALGQGRTAMPFARVVNFEKTSPQKVNE